MEATQKGRRAGFVDSLLNATGSETGDTSDFRSSPLHEKPIIPLEKDVFAAPELKRPSMLDPFFLDIGDKFM